MKITMMPDAGNYATYQKLEGVNFLFKRATRKGMFKWAKDLKQTANRDILDRSKKTGRIYIIRGKKGSRRRHKSSAPGETHANLTGALRKSIAWKVTGDDRLEFGYGIAGKQGPEYASYVEEGTLRRTDGGWLMRPRPSLQNAIRDTTGTAETYFNKEIKDVFE